MQSAYGAAFSGAAMVECAQHGQPTHNANAQVRNKKREPCLECAATHQVHSAHACLCHCTRMAFKQLPKQACAVFATHEQAQAVNTGLWKS